MPSRRIIRLKIGHQVKRVVIEFDASFQGGELLLQGIAEGVKVSEICLQVDRHMDPDACLPTVAGQISRRCLDVIPSVDGVEAYQDLILDLGLGGVVALYRERKHLLDAWEPKVVLKED